MNESAITDSYVEKGDTSAYWNTWCNNRSIWRISFFTFHDRMELTQNEKLSWKYTQRFSIFKCTLHELLLRTSPAYWRRYRVINTHLQHCWYKSACSNYSSHLLELLAQGVIIRLQIEKRIYILKKFTLDEMWVVGLVWREDSGHLVVVGGVDVFINTVPGQLYLLRWTQVMNAVRPADGPGVLFCFILNLNLHAQ